MAGRPGPVVAVTDLNPWRRDRGSAEADRIAASALIQVRVGSVRRCAQGARSARAAAFGTYAFIIACSADGGQLANRAVIGAWSEPVTVLVTFGLSPSERSSGQPVDRGELPVVPSDRCGEPGQRTVSLGLRAVLLGVGGSRVTYA